MSLQIPPHEIEWPGTGVRMAFRYIPKGEFWMGTRGGSGWESNEAPRHRVRMEHDFWLGETVVTQAQFALWTEAEGVEHENHFPGRPNHPAENMSWRQAVQFCDWLTRERLGEFPEGFNLACLPTEAEWEYACRGRTTDEGFGSDYYNGDGEDALAAIGWYEKNSEQTTHSVDSIREQHPFGLRGMHGNVDQWCHDAWDGGAYRRVVNGDLDPGCKLRWDEYAAGMETMLNSDRNRVLRGGSWDYSAWNCRSAYRFRWRPVDRNRYSGFRVCLVRGPNSNNRQVGIRAEAEPGREDGAARDEPAELPRRGVAGADVLEYSHFPPRLSAID